jgi:hypothetical protein
VILQHMGLRRLSQPNYRRYGRRQEVAKDMGHMQLRTLYIGLLTGDS